MPMSMKIGSVDVTCKECGCLSICADTLSRALSLSLSLSLVYQCSATTHSDSELVLPGKQPLQEALQALSFHVPCRRILLNPVLSDCLRARSPSLLFCARHVGDLQHSYLPSHREPSPSLYHGPCQLCNRLQHGCLLDMPSRPACSKRASHAWARAVQGGRATLQ
jgi:hypothetical protein